VFYIVLLALLAALSYLAWQLINSAPRVLSMFLPARLTFAVGFGFFLLALFSAYFSAYAMRDPVNMLNCFVQVYVGLWLMLATSSALRGSESDQQMLRRLFGMVCLMLVTITGTLFTTNFQLISTLNLLLLAGGLWLTTNYFSFLDRGR
jgi:hypothetical protein